MADWGRGVSPTTQPDYTLVHSAFDGSPIFLVPGGYVHLRVNKHHSKPWKFVTGRETCRKNHPYTGELTDEEEALVMKWMLIGYERA